MTSRAGFLEHSSERAARRAVSDGRVRTTQRFERTLAFQIWSCVCSRFGRTHFRPLPMAIRSKTVQKRSVWVFLESSVFAFNFFRIRDFGKSSYYRLGPASSVAIPDCFRTFSFYSFFFVRIASPAPLTAHQRYRDMTSCAGGASAVARSFHRA